LFPTYRDSFQSKKEGDGRWKLGKPFFFKEGDRDDLKCKRGLGGLKIREGGIKLGKPLFLAVSRTSYGKEGFLTSIFFTISWVLSTFLSWRY
ncbi:MAG TPA: hypothetical protein P5155_02070, partial [Candidatus Absconditabacterales bacterium]|nr:hypothetical protein [Candidatus Absconditabacterales bacterium]